MTTDRRNYDVLEQISLDLESLARQLRRVQTSIFKDKVATMSPRKSLVQLQEEISLNLDRATRSNEIIQQSTPGQERLSQQFETLIAELKALNERLDRNEPTA
jgi:hypothetical protein